MNEAMERWTLGATSLVGHWAKNEETETVYSVPIRLGGLVLAQPKEGGVARDLGLRKMDQSAAQQLDVKRGTETDALEGGRLSATQSAMA